MTNSSAQHNLSVIKKADEISHILKNSRKVYTVPGILFLHHKDDADDTKFAVLIKKNTGNAVQRNYRKRIVREYLRKNISRFVPRYNRVIFLYTMPGSIDYQMLTEEIDKKVSK